MNIEALCAAPPEAFAHSPSQMPLSCPVALLSQRELHNSCATSCGTFSAKPCAAFCSASLTCSSFTCRPRKAWGGVEDDAFHDEYLCTSVFRGAQHVLLHVLRHVLRNAMRRVLHVLVPHVLVLQVSPKGKPGVGCALFCSLYCFLLVAGSCPVLEARGGSSSALRGCVPSASALGSEGTQPRRVALRYAAPYCSRRWAASVPALRSRTGRSSGEAVMGRRGGGAPPVLRWARSPGR